MSNILQIAIRVNQATPAWSSRDSSVASLLFINQDLNNTIWLGQTSNITPAGPNTIPILPNGTFSGDAKSTWYVVGSIAGTLPLVVVPNGQGYFLGITQGLGQLVIPKIQSPNYVAGISGWAIKKDGSAEFNNLTIRGTFAGSNYIINNSGEFFYSAAPAFGDLVISIANAAGNDTFTNPYLGGVVLYGPGNSKAVLGWSSFVGSIPLLALFPDASWAYTGNSPVIQSFDTNKGLASEYTALQMGSGNSPGNHSSEIVLWGSSPDGTTSIPHVSIYGGANSVILADFNASRSTMNTYNGASYGINGSDADTTVTTITLNNDVTKTWNVPALDWNVNTAYKLIAWGHGTQAAVATTLGFSVDKGGGGSFASATSAAGFAAANAAFKWKIEAIIICATTGAAGTLVISMSAQIYSGITSTVLVGEQTAVAINTTIANTFQIRATFGANASITCDGSIFEKVGN